METADDHDDERGLVAGYLLEQPAGGGAGAALVVWGGLMPLQGHPADPSADDRDSPPHQRPGTFVAQPWERPNSAEREDPTG
jgi:hypothetical protein